MLKTFINIFRVPELRNKVLFTLMMLAIYRIGYHVPIPGVNQDGLAELAETQSKGGSAAGRLASYVSLFSGGSLSQSTIFGLGVMLTSRLDIFSSAHRRASLEKLQKEGETGHEENPEWTRYATVPLGRIRRSSAQLHAQRGRPATIESCAARSSETRRDLGLGITC